MQSIKRFRFSSKVKLKVIKKNTNVAAGYMLHIYFISILRNWLIKIHTVNCKINTIKFRN